MNPETVIKKPEPEFITTLPYSSSLTDNQTIDFEIKGLRSERSYEDRDIYLAIKSHDNRDDSKIREADVDMCMWIKGEKAIELGMELIAAGKYALEANMIQHQLIHHQNQMDRFLRDGCVAKIIFTLKERNCVGYGQGHMLFNTKLIWVEGKIPKYNEDFNFDSIIYWSQLEDDFAKQIERHTQGVDYEFAGGYNHNEEMRKFKKILDKMQEKESDV